MWKVFSSYRISSLLGDGYGQGGEVCEVWVKSEGLLNLETFEEFVVIGLWLSSGWWCIVE